MGEDDEAHRGWVGVHWRFEGEGTWAGAKVLEAANVLEGADNVHELEAAAFVFAAVNAGCVGGIDERRIEVALELGRGCD